MKFTKMHGLGNDFAVFDGVNQTVEFSAEQVRALADRHTGIGFDQLLIVAKPSRDEVDFDYKIYNADGSEVSQCGNGARCVARFIHDQGLSDKSDIKVATSNAVMALTLREDGLVAVDMGAPIVQLSCELLVAGLKLHFGVCSLGNPHAVTIVENLDKAPVLEVGEALQQHDAFPAQVNVGFVEVESPTKIKCRVYERGAGETQACGSGACAAVVVGRLKAELAEQVDVELLGGRLQVQWQGEGASVWMTGPAETVYVGELF